MISESSFHRGANSKGLMDSADGQLLDQARILLSQPRLDESPLRGPGGCFRGGGSKKARRESRMPRHRAELPQDTPEGGKEGQPPLHQHDCTILGRENLVHNLVHTSFNSSHNSSLRLTTREPARARINSGLYRLLTSGSISLGNN